MKKRNPYLNFTESSLKSQFSRSKGRMMRRARTLLFAWDAIVLATEQHFLVTEALVAKIRKKRKK